MASPKKTRSRTGATKKPKASTEGGTATLERDEDEETARSASLGLDVDDEVLEFIAALDRFKKEHNRNFPNWSEVLHVLKSLGYRRG
ncbi:MAG: hypothetical protein RIT24_1552 [Planctomycetota bacterium]|jgi:hypothetical protein